MPTSSSATAGRQCTVPAPLPKNPGYSYSFASYFIATAAQISARVDQLADVIAADYTRLHPPVSASNPLVLVCVLKGSYIFTADLARALFLRGVPTTTQFMRFSSYGGTTSSSGSVRLLTDIQKDSARGRHALVVEDILDTGKTLSKLHDVFLQRGALSLRIAVLLDKVEARVVKTKNSTTGQIDQPFMAHYTGFSIPNAFVVGYGMDYGDHEALRDVPDIVVMKPDIYMTHGSKPVPLDITRHKTTKSKL